MERKLMTICIVRQEDNILLGFKKTGFGINLWNGFGGKVENGETIEEAAIRELKGESGLEALNIFKKGILYFTFQNNSILLEVHIFLTDKFIGTPVETNEMKPKWFSIKEIPYDKMWEDDKFWVPMFLNGNKFKGSFLFDRPSDQNYCAKVLKHELLEVDNL